MFSSSAMCFAPNNRAFAACSAGQRARLAKVAVLLLSETYECKTVCTKLSPKPPCPGQAHWQPVPLVVLTSTPHLWFYILHWHGPLPASRSSPPFLLDCNSSFPSANSVPPQRSSSSCLWLSMPLLSCLAPVSVASPEGSESPDHSSSVCLDPH